MPWYNGDYPPSYKNQPPRLRAKAVEIANALLAEGVSEGIAIATGLKQARNAYTPLNKKKNDTPPGEKADQSRKVKQDAKKKVPSGKSSQ